MAQETIKRRKRKRGSEMSMKELQQLEFLKWRTGCAILWNIAQNILLLPQANRHTEVHPHNHVKRGENTLPSK